MTGFGVVAVTSAIPAAPWWGPWRPWGRSTAAGRCPPTPRDAREELHATPGLYRQFNRLPNEFKQRFGSTQCRLLTSQWRKTWLGKEHLQFCRNLVIESAGLAAEMAVPQDLARWGSLPFGAQHP
jgi:hypothetical protein